MGGNISICMALFSDTISEADLSLLAIPKRVTVHNVIITKQTPSGRPLALLTPLFAWKMSVSSLVPFKFCAETMPNISRHSAPCRHNRNGV